MKCPHCHHVIESNRLKCAHCDMVFDRDRLETLKNVEFTPVPPPTPTLKPGDIWPYATALSLAAALGLVAQTIELPLNQYASAMVVLSAVYLLVGWLLKNRQGEGTPRPLHYYRAALTTGWLLLAAGSSSGAVNLLADVWSAVGTLTLATVVLVGAATLYRSPWPLGLAAGLFILPFAATVIQVMIDSQVGPWQVWLIAALTLLALEYQCWGIGLRRHVDYAALLYLWAHVLTILALSGLVAVTVISHLFYIKDMVGANEATLLALGGVILAYLTSAFLHHSGRHPALSRFTQLMPGTLASAVFLWPLSILVPLWLGVTVRWLTPALPLAWLGPFTTGMGLASVGVGQVLARQRTEYRQPFHSAAHVLTLIGVLLALDVSWALLAALVLAIASLVSDALAQCN